MNYDSADTIYKIAFASVRGMGYDLAQKFLDVLHSERDFFEASETSLREIANSRSKIFSREYRNQQLEKARRELEFAQAHKIGLTYYTDAEYPQRLANAADAPILLYSKGSCDLNAKHVVSIVGTRHATPYGQNFVRKLVAGLAEMLDDVVVVSGLAYGIDVEAHRASLSAGLPTVAVLAHGLNMIYPSQHRGTAIEMMNNKGMLLTDYMSQDEMHRGNFLARNRIVAGLSDCTVVAESARRGGALVTASLASGYNRDVFALPGRTSDEFSSGCNYLIQNNLAALVTNAEDLVRIMRWEPKNKAVEPQQTQLFPELTAQEKQVLELLAKNGDMHINSITNALQIPVYKVMSMMVELEFKGVVLTLPGCRYSKA